MNAANDPEKLKQIIADMRANPDKYSAKQRMALVTKMQQSPELFRLGDRVDFMPRQVSDMGGDIPADDLRIIEAALANESHDPESMDKYNVAHKAAIDALNRGADYGKVQPYLTNLREAQATAKNLYKSGFGIKPGNKTSDIRTGEMQRNPMYWEAERKTYRTYDPESPEDVKNKFKSSIVEASFPLLDEHQMQRTYENQPATSQDRFNLEQRIREAQDIQDRELKMQQMMNEQLYKYAEQNKDKET